MPELAEVAYYSRQWDQGFELEVLRAQANQDKRIFGDEDVKAMLTALVGLRLLHSELHGKQLLFAFSDNVFLGIHLGMTGKLLWRMAGSSHKHEHLRLETKEGTMVFRDPRLFGRVRFEQTKDLPAWWRDLPPEILSPSFDFALFSQILKRRAKAPLKAVLLMQKFFPGVGNWMADEILWRARILPMRAAASLSSDERKTLFQAIKFVCRGAMRHVAPSHGNPPASWLFQHRWKDGGVCSKSGGELVRDQVGGRTTCWSPQWQR